MKKMLLFVFLLIAIVPSQHIFAQYGGDLFTAKDGWNNTKDNYPDYELVTLFTYSDFDSLVYIDFPSGTADTWDYYYRNVNDNWDTKLVEVIKLDDYLPFVVSDGDTLPPQLKNLENINWLDSDKFFESFTKNQEFINYIHSNNINSLLILLIYNFDNEEGLPAEFLNKHVWIVEVNEDFFCVMDAVTGDLFCEQFTTEVNDDITTQSIKIFPQPASDEITVIMPQGFSANSFELYNLFGQKIAEQSVSSFAKVITIPVDRYPAGTYFLKINSGTYCITKKISVIK